jgi:hypothetical protein
MHIETLQTFCHLVETGSFTKAAQRGFISQSAVSQQLRTLEARYGQPLIERGSRPSSPRPTPAVCSTPNAVNCSIGFAGSKSACGAPPAPFPAWCGWRRSTASASTSCRRT